MRIPITRPIQINIEKDFLKEKCHSLARLNIFSISMISGCGLPVDIPDEKLVKLLKKGTNESDEKTRDFLNTFRPLQAVYTSFRPQLKNNLLNASYFDNLITIENQALAIICECKLAKQLYNESLNEVTDKVLRVNKISLSLLVMKACEAKIKFISNSLMDTNGSYIYTPAGKNITMHLRAAKQCSFSDIGLLMEAFIEAAKTLDDIQYPLFNNSKHSVALSHDTQEIFQNLYEGIDVILSSSTEEISLITLSLIKFYKFTYSYENEKQCYEMIIKCCAEIESRVTFSKDLKHPNRFHSPYSSLLEGFTAIKALIHSYLFIGIDKFRECAIQIFNTIDHLWNDDYMIYFERSTKIMKIYCDEAAVIINSHYWLSTIDKTLERKTFHRMLCMFNAFYEQFHMQLSSISPELQKYTCPDPQFENIASARFLPVLCSFVKVRSNCNNVIVNESRSYTGKALKASIQFLDIIENMY